MQIHFQTIHPGNSTASTLQVTRQHALSATSSNYDQSPNTAFATALEQAQTQELLASLNSSDSLSGLSSLGVPSSSSIPGLSPSGNSSEALSAYASLAQQGLLGDLVGSGSDPTTVTSTTSSLTAGTSPTSLMAYIGAMMGLEAPGSGLTPVFETQSSPPVSNSLLSSSPVSSVDSSPTQSWIRSQIDKLAPEYGLSPSVVSAVVQEESGFSPSALSSAGAMGLMQLMPATATMLGVTNPYDPVQNLRGGMTYLSHLVAQYNGSLPLALAAYNAGPGAVSNYGGIPPYPETQAYVSNIMQNIG